MSSRKNADLSVVRNKSGVGFEVRRLHVGAAGVDALCIGRSVFRLRLANLPVLDDRIQTSAPYLKAGLCSTSNDVREEPTLYDKELPVTLFCCPGAEWQFSSRFALADEYVSHNRDETVTMLGF